ncbi:MAG: alpha/beta fold hydrolase [Chthonomonadales bacterium]|nr:alpha/beta fold hydrolase [Chthonomonadales bacterium]
MASHVISVHKTKARPAAHAERAEASFHEGLPGEPTFTTWQGHRIHYRRLGVGPALVLVHAPDVGACCLEWRRNLEPLAADHTVFAVDLPGFGLSSARPIPYGSETYIRFLRDFLHDVVGPGADVLGSVLGASYLVHVAARWPATLGKLVLVALAGLSALRPNLLGAVAFQVLSLPGLSAAVWGTSTSRYSILEHLQRDVYANDEWAGPQTVDARYWGCHRPNAAYVERSRLAGLLNTDLRTAAGQVRQPVLLCWGRNAACPPLADVEAFRERAPHANLAIFEHSALAPQEEESHRFNQAVRTFLSIDAPPLAA